jgi:putative ABC transport system ATP-binding protein
MIRCRNIQKFYGEGDSRVEALRGIDMDIERGELHLLMGPSGSGKTTLISIIAGILTPDVGECFIDGVDFHALSERNQTRFRKENIGFVFQAYNLIPMLSNEENISIPLLLQGMDRNQALERGRAIMEELGMADKIGATPVDLSGGQRQRVAIGRAIIHNPKLIVCDEPTSALDFNTGQKVMQLLQQMVEKKNLTLIVVTHDPRLVPYAHHIDHLEDGRIVPAG